MATVTSEKMQRRESPDVNVGVDGVAVQYRPDPAPLNARTYKEKSLADAYILSFVPIFGLVGCHHFYLNRIWMGVAYSMTLGLFGVGYVIDIFRTPCLVKDYNRKVRNGECPVTSERSLTDAYILWFPCGLFGMHHFYLGNLKLGILYLLTFGLFGIGWLVDVVRMPSLVRQANQEVRHDEDSRVSEERSSCIAYALAVPPLGLCGAHHFYLGRVGWGMLYANTLGGFGIGWLCDWFRISTLVSRANREHFEDPLPPCSSLTGISRKYMDDLFILWLPPLGLFGAHHFYLGRVGWGSLYLLTFGGLGIGWLIDAFRLKSLLREYNTTAEELRKLNRKTVPSYVHPTQQNGGGSLILTLAQRPEGAAAVPANQLNAWHTAAYPSPSPQYQAGVHTGPAAPPPGYSGPGPQPTAPPPYSQTAWDGNQIYPHLPPKDN